MEKMDFRSLTSQDRYRYRKRAISLIQSGEKKKEVALIFGVRPSTVSEWVKCYKEEGV